MLADLQNVISDKQSLIQAVGTLVGTNVIDLGAVGTIPQGGNPIYDIGRGFRMPGVHVQITTTVLAAGGAAEIDFRICSSANNDLSSPTVRASTGAIGKATLVAGYQVPVGLAMPSVGSDRYAGMNYVVTTNNVTAGAVVAQLVTTRQTTPNITS